MRDVELKKALRGDSILNVKVTNATGKEFEMCLCPDQSVQFLKEKISGENPKDGVHYKLLSMTTNRFLDERKTLAEEGINDNDELVLVKRRRARKPIKDELANTKGADALKIEKLTAEAGKVKGNKVPMLGAGALHFDFNCELQRILITLIDAAHLVQFDNETEVEDLSTSVKTEAVVNQDHLKQLTDMGFAETRATKALLLNRSSGVQGAMEWLLQYESSPDIDEPLPSQHAKETESNENTVKSNHSKPHRRREFVPNKKGVEVLKDMGFPEEDVIKALKATGNNQRAACDWLLGERHDVVDDGDPGLNPDSPLCVAIMENPAVQLSLTNPRILAAFQEMLENPLANAHYITDPETGPVLLQISRIVQGFAR